MKKHIIAVLAYLLVSLPVQALSHLVIFADHYNATGFIRPQPLFALGFAALLIQGLVISLVFARTTWASRGFLGAIAFSLIMGLFLVSHEGMAEAAKYKVPDAGAWVAVEFATGFVQYLLAGIGLGLAHRIKPQPHVREVAA